jgi:ssDNA-binding Zn-finger/Zn-ribbon topoisomerase 1
MPTCVKICRDCGEEFRAEAVRCSDCGGELEERFLDENGDFVLPDGSAAAPSRPSVPEEEATDLPPDHRVVFVTPRAADLVPLAEALRESHVPYRLAEQPGRAEHAPPQYALLVPNAEAAAALQALAPLLAPESDADLVHVEARFEAGRGYVRCPACGAARPHGATECSDCGLGFGDEAPAVCPRCGGPIADPETGCPSCGGGTPVDG